MRDSGGRNIAGNTRFDFLEVVIGSMVHKEATTTDRLAMDILFVMLEAWLTNS